MIDIGRGLLLHHVVVFPIIMYIVHTSFSNSCTFLAASSVQSLEKRYVVVVVVGVDFKSQHLSKKKGKVASAL